ncbi:MAG: hypothetical protein M1338_00305 [Patescibacteria group bacterium]|nr:hypothetical protein [Patescibacteria group bacterium]
MKIPESSVNVLAIIAVLALLIISPMALSLAIITLEKKLNHPPSEAAVVRALYDQYGVDESSISNIKLVSSFSDSCTYQVVYLDHNNTKILAKAYFYKNKDGWKLNCYSSQESR